MRPRSARLELRAHGYAQRVFADDLASSLGVDVRTVRRWIRGAQAMPETSRRLAEILHLGVLPWSGWAGFAVDPSDERLYSPNGYAWSRGELEHWGLVVQRLEARRRALLSAGADVPSSPW